MIALVLLVLVGMFVAWKLLALVVKVLSITLVAAVHVVQLPLRLLP
jgi:hypothetical protein